MTLDPKTYNTPARETLIQADVAQLGSAVLALTREMWVLHDRVRTLEAVLERRGIDVIAEIETFQPGPELQAERNAQGKVMVGNVINALAGLDTV